jgi:hypothetical protein
MDQRSWSHLDMDRLGATHSFGTSCTYQVSDSLDKQPSFVHSTTMSHTGLLQQKDLFLPCEALALFKQVIF